MVYVASYLPTADAEQEAEHIRLLPLLQFFDVFKGTHLRGEILELATTQSRKCKKSNSCRTEAGHYTVTITIQARTDK